VHCLGVCFSPGLPCGAIETCVLRSASWFLFKLETLIKTISILHWASSSDDFSHLLQNLTLNLFIFLPTAGLLFDDEWMQLQLVRSFSVGHLPVLSVFYHLKLALYCAMTEHFAIIVLFVYPCDIAHVWCKSGSSQLGEEIFVILGSQVSLRVHYCKRDEVHLTPGPQ